MANHESAKKRIRRNLRAAVVNGDRRNRIRTFIKKVEAAIFSGDVAKAEEEIKIVQPELARGAAKGVFSKKAASRKLSRLHSRIKKLKEAA